MLIGIDPGVQRSAWAKLDDTGALIACGMGAWRNLLFDSDYFAVIEVPQIYRQMKGDPNDLIDLAVVVGQLSAYFEKYMLVRPAQWKGQVPKPVHQARILSKLTVRERALVDGSKGLKKDIIDAVGIAKWGYYDRKM
jgi:hypothetical protein